MDEIADSICRTGVRLPRFSAAIYRWDAALPASPPLVRSALRCRSARAKINARGIYRDPVRSSKGHFVKASGLRWLSAMLLVQVVAPKNSIRPDSRSEAESAHHCIRWSRSSACLQRLSPTCSSRGGGLKPKFCFSVINSISR